MPYDSIDSKACFNTIEKRNKNITHALTCTYAKTIINDGYETQGLKTIYIAYKEN